MMQAQRSAKKTVSAMKVLVSRNDDDDEEEESRTGMVLESWIQPWTKNQVTLKETELEVRKISSNGYK